MNVAAFDVFYSHDGSASAAAVLFSDYEDPELVAMHTVSLLKAAEYLPGEFYLRELPCILKLCDQFNRLPDELIVDGYVRLGERPGLGYHLYSALGGKVPVIGVAKSKYKGALGIEILRGSSARPLYITAAGMDPAEAAERIQGMHGIHRIPTLLKHVDRLARESIGRSGSCPS